MRYRIYFEPIDIQADNPDDAQKKYYNEIADGSGPLPNRVLPIDKDGFPIEQIKQQVE